MSSLRFFAQSPWFPHVLLVGPEGTKPLSQLIVHTLPYSCLPDWQDCGSTLPYFRAGSLWHLIARKNHNFMFVSFAENAAYVYKSCVNHPIEQWAGKPFALTQFAGYHFYIRNYIPCRRVGLLRHYRTPSPNRTVHIASVHVWELAIYCTFSLKLLLVR